MAFRGYELNLMLRVQDRASSRLRRIASDLGGVSKAGQLQTRMAQNQASQARNYQKQASAIMAIESASIPTGEARLATESRRFRIQSQLLAGEERMRKNGLGQMRLQRVLEGATRQDLGLSKQKMSILTSQAAAIKASAAFEANVVKEAEALQLALGAANAEQALLTKEAQATAAAYKLAAGRQQLMTAGRRATHAGSALTIAGGIGTAALGASSAMFANFDTQAVRAATQTGNVGESFRMTVDRAKELEKIILGLGQTFPATADEMASSAYDLFSSMSLGDAVILKNLHSVDELHAGVKLLTMANRVAVAGQTDLATATNTMITTFNNFDPTLSHTRETLDQMFAIIRFGRMDFAQFNDMMNSVAPAAAQAGQSLVQVGAAMSVITRSIPSQARAGTALARLLDVFSSKDFQAGMEKLSDKTGLDFKITDQSGKLLPLFDIITKIVNMAPDLAQGGKEINNLIQTTTAFGANTKGRESTVQARRALVLLIKSYQLYGENLKDITADNNEYLKSYQALNQSYGVQWKIFMNQLRVLVLMIGQQAIPIFIQLGDWVQSLVEKWQGLSEHTRGLIIKVAALGAILSLVSGVILSMGGGFAILVASFATIIGISAAAATGWLALAIAAGVVTVYIITHWEEVKRWWKAFWGISFTAIVKAGLVSTLGNIKLFVAAALSQILVLAEGLAKIKIFGKSIVPGADAAANFLEGVVSRLAKSGARDQVKAAKILGDSFKDQLKKQKLAEAFDDNITGDKPGTGKKSTAVEKFIAKFKKQVKALNTKDLLAAMNAYSNTVSGAGDSTSKLTRAQQLNTERVRAMRQATEESTNAVKGYVDNLVAKYKELEEANKSAFGDILSGPISQGPIMQAFSQINTTLAGVGAKPIKIPVQFILQDAQNQLANFKIWRDSLVKLAKRGVPREMINELQSKGVAALPEILSIAGGSKGFLNQYIKVWKDSKAIKDKATSQDMDNTLKLWNSYGHDVAWKIIQGLASDPAQAKLRDGFNQYVVGTFGDVIKAGIAKETNAAIAAWIKEHPESVKSAKTKEAAGDKAFAASVKTKPAAHPVTTKPVGHSPKQGNFVVVKDGPTYKVDIKNNTPQEIVNAFNMIHHKARHGSR